MPVISVVTPVYKPNPEYLLAAYESVRTQQLPAGWNLEWIVQEDGTTGVLEEILPSDQRTILGMAPHVCAAQARNNAVTLSSGELIKNLDGDDVLTPGALARDIEVLAGNPDVQWTTSRVLDLLEDGTTVGFDSDPDTGRLEPGTVWDYWRTHDRRLPVHPTTVCIRKPLLSALGGWTVIPASEDTAMLIAANVISVGYFIGEVGLLYRKWSGQTTASPSYNDARAREDRIRLIDERAMKLSEGPSWTVE